MSKVAKIIYGALGVVLAVFAAYQLVSPKVEVSVLDYPFPNNPFYARFEFKDTGTFAVKKFRIQCSGLT